MSDLINITNLKRKKRLLERYGSSCPYCLRELRLENLTVDHVIPRMAYSPKHKHSHPLHEIASRLKDFFHNKELTGGERIYVCFKCNKNRETKSLIEFLKSAYIAKHFNHVAHKETSSLT